MFFFFYGTLKSRRTHCTNNGLAGQHIVVLGPIRLQLQYMIAFGFIGFIGSVGFLFRTYLGPTVHYLPRGQYRPSI